MTEQKAAGSVRGDCRELMKQLARMAGVPAGLYRKMVLVLDVDDPPKLYGEQYLVRELDDPLVETQLDFAEKRVEVRLDGGLSCE